MSSTHLAMKLPGRAMLTVHFLGAIGLKTAVGLVVSTSAWTLSAF